VNWTIKEIRDWWFVQDLEKEEWPSFMQRVSPAEIKQVGSFGHQFQGLSHCIDADNTS